MSGEDLDYLDGIGWEEFRRRNVQRVPYPTRADAPVRPARAVLPVRPVVVREEVVDEEMMAELARTRALAEQIREYAEQSCEEWIRRRELVQALAPKHGYRVSAAALLLEARGYIEIQRYKKAGKHTFRLRLV